MKFSSLCLGWRLEASKLNRAETGKLQFWSKPSEILYLKSSTHSRIGHYFFSYLITCEVHLIEVLEIMAQMQQYIIFITLSVCLNRYLQSIVSICDLGII